ncbi:IMS domain-containing protein [Cronbergia sp. UHCC 0137]|uniref:IMS domain-containing protein n=1 Tax=Cronbergia sp. UHCC 0137 TaxID=3110239 RepID=UPI002B206EE9|nr:IMS domain-containing protein [Cronbergia sp. UHCC 0137]MEA5618321.1 IMS domain-containing protein [Cronbergia sp. UHCC 0137]
MRIPLDYYRILGLPLAASDEQLRQAYSDRIVQLPRREYSIAAISSRKQLIEEAYVVLSDSKQRSTYDQLYLAHAYAPDRAENQTDNNQEQDAQGLSIEITADELIGSMLILQELGEYELVLKLGRPYLVNRNAASSSKTTYHPTSQELSESSELPDIILTVALACLELGREQWQQGHYENAAISLETGEQLLLRERLFPNVQAEITLDLYKLRPYRILELLALPLEKTAERRQGLKLLQNILEDRGGIDGARNDQSGLNIDDFLRFIQQLRNHLTVTEQHKIFEVESKRPSAVGTYLTVYALIARGFTQRQPALIRQAKLMLIPLAKRQDVHLEQSLCALLLGQTEEATRVLELSQEYEALAIIREKSKDSPDLLPGLCLYSEQWLQKEVFPHFRDLAKQQASLKVYFADSKVQAYLEALPNDAQATNEWAVVNHQSFPEPQTNHIPEVDQESEYSHFSSSAPVYGSGQAPELFTPQPPTPAPEAKNDQKHVNNDARVSPPVPPHGKRRKRRKLPDRGHGQPIFANTLEAKTRLVWTVFASLVGLLVFGLLVSTTFGLVKNLLFPRVSVLGVPLAIELNQPPVVIPDPTTQERSLEGPLTNDTAEQVIQNWLSTKAAALGPNHEIGNLDQILTGSALSQWRLIIQQDIADNRYRRYVHNLKVELVNNVGISQNHAVVEAQVNEVTDFYESSQKKTSTQENLLVRYNLIRTKDGWRIHNMSVVNNR